MPYSDKEAKAQRQRERRLKPREAPGQNEAPGTEAPPILKPLGEAPKRWNVTPGVPPGGYDPKTDGIDGWHKDKRPYVLQRSFGSGSIRSYAPAPANFSYYQELPYARPDAVRLFKGDIGRVLNG